MPLFHLDAVRNASIDREVEPALEAVREEVARFPFDFGERADRGDVLAVYDVARPRLNVLVSALKNMTGSAGIDIGSGFGFLPVLLARYGVRTIAADPDTALTVFAVAHDIEVRPYRIGHLPQDIGPFDFAVLSEVIEHLKIPPIRVLQEIARVLRPGARFLLTTPNVARLSHIEALLAGENFLEPFDESTPDGDDPTDYVEHVREYSIREILDVVEAAGFEIERVVMTGWGDAGYDALPNPHLNEICVVQATR